jgi:hypothetical protein
MYLCVQRVPSTDFGRSWSPAAYGSAARDTNPNPLIRPDHLRWWRWRGNGGGMRAAAGWVRCRVRLMLLPECPFYRRVRRRLPGRWRQGRPVRRSGAADECLCGTVRAHGPDRGHRPALIAAASSAHRDPTTLAPTSPRSGSSADRSSAASSTSTSGSHRSPGQAQWPSSETPQVRRGRRPCRPQVCSQQPLREGPGGQRRGGPWRPRRPRTASAPARGDHRRAAGQPSPIPVTACKAGVVRSWPGGASRCAARPA